jgi:hypothetical protein
MDAEIHAVDRARRESEGNALYVRGVRIEVAVKRYDGLPFGEDKDHQYLEVRASSWDGDTNSSLVARLNSDDLQRLFDTAISAGIIDIPANERAIGLLEQLRHELAAKSLRWQMSDQ